MVCCGIAPASPAVVGLEKNVGMFANVCVFGVESPTEAVVNDDMTGEVKSESA